MTAFNQVGVTPALSHGRTVTPTPHGSSGVPAALPPVARSGMERPSGKLNGNPADGSSAQRTERKIALLQRCGLFGGKPVGVEITRACTPDALAEAYALVHTIFVEQGYCRPTDYGMRLRIFEATPQMATFVARAENKVVGVLSVVGDSAACGLPSDQACQRELDGFRNSPSKASLCEWSNQVVAHDYRKTNVPTELMRCAAAHVIKAGYSHSVIAVSSVHSGFYELLGFRQIGPKRSYSTDVDDPVIPLCLPSDVYLAADQSPDEVTEFIRRFMAEENPFLSEIEAWDAEARQMFSKPEHLRRLFTQRSNFLRQCGLGLQTTLLHQWNPRIYRQVLGDTRPEALRAWFITFCEIMLPLLGSRYSRSEV